ncbi:thiamine pyrophosphokinase [Bifidobacterium commune]|uniref:Thiamine diphosphokinase n=1 Tax=Bifidobacterium commune TaxID=1505727 RepID=A0A1C4H039_9BIFI|nr:thiamine diphosphokinase [Bifidobacterium commune]MBB2955150.1 thiamine pyrophosphokinase [Bifidobacterium commune]SCC78283.1 thiamine pyrophosphokinase [Bifidobacterium commune]
MSQSCVIFAAGSYYGNEPHGGDLPIDALVIAADGGFDHANVLGIKPDLVIGDFDSANASIPQGIETIRLPAEHDDPDMLSALKIGWSRGCRDFFIYGALGGRIDHAIANVQLLAFLSHHGGRGLLFGGDSVVTAICNGSLTFMPHSHKTVALEAATNFPITTIAGSSHYGGFMPDRSEDIALHSSSRGTYPEADSSDTGHRISHTISVFSYSNVSTGVSETGLKYELDNVTICNDEVLGVSNEFLDGRPASINVADGTLIVTFPTGTAPPTFRTTVKPSETLGPLASQVSASLSVHYSERSPKPARKP